jgi:DNA-binding MarR family transcriptional regulator
MKPLNLESYLPYRLSVASNKVSALISKAYEARFGLTIPQWRLLAILSEGQPLSQQKLVSRTAMDKVTVSRAAQALITRGLVQSKPSDKDRRAVELSLTEAGVSVVQDVAPVALAFEKSLIEAIGGPAAERLDLMLRKLEEQAEKLAKKARTHLGN